MSLLGNILWLIFGGLLTGLAYIFAGLLLCIWTAWPASTQPFIYFQF